MNTFYEEFLKYMSVGLPSDTSKNQIKRKRNLDKHREHKNKRYHKRNEQGRNEPCACGSGKKYKKCHGRVINEND